MTRRISRSPSRLQLTRPACDWIWIGTLVNDKGLTLMPTPSEEFLFGSGTTRTKKSNQTVSSSLPYFLPRVSYDALCRQWRSCTLHLDRTRCRFRDRACRSDSLGGLDYMTMINRSVCYRICNLSQLPVYHMVSKYVMGLATVRMNHTETMSLTRDSIIGYRNLCSTIVVVVHRSLSHLLLSIYLNHSFHFTFFLPNCVFQN